MTEQVEKTEICVETEPFPGLTVLDFDPFEGDFGDQGDRVFSDAIVKARKRHRCSHCCGPILVGEKYRSRSEKSDGELRAWKWCNDCCVAMLEELLCRDSDDESDEPFPFESRHGLHEMAAQVLGKMIDHALTRNAQ